jgi:hypothetical protein
MKIKTLEEIAMEIAQEEQDNKALIQLVNAMNDKVACDSAKDVWGRGR